MNDAKAKLEALSGTVELSLLSKRVEDLEAKLDVSSILKEAISTEVMQKFESKIDSVRSILLERIDQMNSVISSAKQAAIDAAKPSSEASLNAMSAVKQAQENITDFETKIEDLTKKIHDGEEFYSQMVDSIKAQTSKLVTSTAEALKASINALNTRILEEGVTRLAAHDRLELNVETQAEKDTQLETRIESVSAQFEQLMSHIRDTEANTAKEVEKLAAQLGEGLAGFKDTADGMIADAVVEARTMLENSQQETSNDLATSLNSAVADIHPRIAQLREYVDQANDSMTEDLAAVQMKVEKVGTALDQGLAVTRTAIAERLRAMIDEHANAAEARNQGLEELIAGVREAMEEGVKTTTDRIGEVDGAVSTLRGDVTRTIKDLEASTAAETSAVRDSVQKHKAAVTEETTAIRTVMAAQSEATTDRMAKLEQATADRLAAFDSQIAQIRAESAAGLKAVNSVLQTAQAEVESATAETAASVAHHVAALNKKYDLLSDDVRRRVDEVHADLQGTCDEINAKLSALEGTHGADIEMQRRALEDLDGRTASSLADAKDAIEASIAETRAQTAAADAELRRLLSAQSRVQTESLDKAKESFATALGDSVDNSHGNLVAAEARVIERIHTQAAGAANGMRSLGIRIDKVANSLAEHSSATTVRLGDLDTHLDIVDRKLASWINAAPGRTSALGRDIEGRTRMALRTWTDKIDQTAAELKNEYTAHAKDVDERFGQVSELHANVKADVVAVRAELAAAEHRAAAHADERMTNAVSRADSVQDSLAERLTAASKEAEEARHALSETLRDSIAAAMNQQAEDLAAVREEAAKAGKEDEARDAALSARIDEVNAALARQAEEDEARDAEIVESLENKARELETATADLESKTTAALESFRLETAHSAAEQAEKTHAMINTVTSAVATTDAALQTQKAETEALRETLQALEQSTRVLVDEVVSSSVASATSAARQDSADLNNRIDVLTLKLGAVGQSLAQETVDRTEEFNAQQKKVEALIQGLEETQAEQQRVHTEAVEAIREQATVEMARVDDELAAVNNAVTRENTELKAAVDLAIETATARDEERYANALRAVEGLSTMLDEHSIAVTKQVDATSARITAHEEATTKAIEGVREYARAEASTVQSHVDTVAKAVAQAKDTIAQVDEKHGKLSEERAAEAVKQAAQHTDEAAKTLEAALKDTRGDITLELADAERKVVLLGDDLTAALEAEAKARAEAVAAVCADAAAAKDAADVFATSVKDEFAAVREEAATARETKAAESVKRDADLQEAINTNATSIAKVSETLNCAVTEAAGRDERIQAIVAEQTAAKGLIDAVAATADAAVVSANKSIAGLDAIPVAAAATEAKLMAELESVRADVDASLKDERAHTAARFALTKEEAARADKEVRDTLQIKTMSLSVNLEHAITEAEAGLQAQVETLAAKHEAYVATADDRCGAIEQTAAALAETVAENTREAERQRVELKEETHAHVEASKAVVMAAVEDKAASLNSQVEALEETIKAESNTMAALSKRVSSHTRATDDAIDAFQKQAGASITSISQTLTRATESLESDLAAVNEKMTANVEVKFNSAVSAISQAEERVTMLCETLQRASLTQLDGVRVDLAERLAIAEKAATNADHIAKETHASVKAFKASISASLEHTEKSVSAHQKRSEGQLEALSAELKTEFTELIARERESRSAASAGLTEEIKALGTRVSQHIRHIEGTAAASFDRLRGEIRAEAESRRADDAAADRKFSDRLAENQASFKAKLARVADSVASVRGLVGTTDESVLRKIRELETAVSNEVVTRQKITAAITADKTQLTKAMQVLDRDRQKATLENIAALKNELAAANSGVMERMDAIEARFADWQTFARTRDEDLAAHVKRSQDSSRESIAKVDSTVSRVVATSDSLNTKLLQLEEDLTTTKATFMRQIDTILKRADQAISVADSVSHEGRVLSATVETKLLDLGQPPRPQSKRPAMLSTPGMSRSGSKDVILSRVRADDDASSRASTPIAAAEKSVLYDEWYKPVANDPIDERVQQVLRDLNMPYRIHFPRMGSGVYFAGKRLQVMVGHDGTLYCTPLTGNTKGEPTKLATYLQGWIKERAVREGNRA
ncbi:chromosome segregation protein [Carpediemonas membranifera]|uniref:Chromosome segregation protein n=1 Tax=Carpediemonas membranifera TaxID=201153 RepID=A0A8J6E1U1_9EUKA|nr:chromosome segregation protein [Carpediemonas membranifera]|eukprot:KAG9396789.1 chromosome segregation protein [Carpediemonas membranifera]